jgi:hypothetical protein
LTTKKRWLAALVGVPATLTAAVFAVIRANRRVHQFGDDAADGDAAVVASEPAPPAENPGEDHSE